MAARGFVVDAPSEGKRRLGFFRLMLILSSFSPLWLIWWARGLPPFPAVVMAGHSFAGSTVASVAVVLLSLLPTGLVAWRWHRATKKRQFITYTLHSVEDGRGQIFEYLLAVLLTMFFVDIGTPRALGAALAAFSLIVWVFAHMDLHHANLLVGLRRYRIYLCHLDGHNRRPIIVLARQMPPTNQALDLLRLDDRLYVRLP
jgi:hypothetical protein